MSGDRLTLDVNTDYQKDSKGYKEQYSKMEKMLKKNKKRSRTNKISGRKVNESGVLWMEVVRMKISIKSKRGEVFVQIRSIIINDCLSCQRANDHIMIHPWGTIA